MKNKINIAGFAVLFLAAVLLTAAGTQQDKKDKGQQTGQDKGKGKGQDKGKKDDAGQDRGNSGNPGRGNADNKGQGKIDNNKGQGNANGQGNGRGNKADDADVRGNETDNRGKGHNNGKMMGDDGFRWDDETFRNRDKHINKEKVTVCHKFKNNDEPAVTIRVSAHALKAHINHGDVQGECPAIQDKRFSNNFLETRTDYFNTVQANTEQVQYSRSILDYARERLEASRRQLVTMQNNNLPAPEIERKQVVVTELEQNVSLLETLVQAAATLVVNKLAD